MSTPQPEVVKVRAGITRRFLTRVNRNVEGFTGVAQEHLRNSAIYGAAKEVHLYTGMFQDQRALFIYEPKGRGFTREGLTNYCCIGSTEAHGSGHGARGSSWTIGKRLTVFTYLRGESGCVARWSFTHEEFDTAQINRDMLGYATGNRTDYRDVPEKFESGTLTIISDIDDLPWKKIHDVDYVRASIQRVLYTMRTLTVLWTPPGTKREVRIAPPPIVGETIFEQRGIRLQNGEQIDLCVKIASDPLVAPVQVAHSTPLFSFKEFLNHIKHNNAELYATIHEAVRLPQRAFTGYLIIPSAAEFQTQGQNNLSIDYYTSSSCEALVECLNSKLAPALIRGVAEYDERHKNEIVSQAISQLSSQFGGEPTTVASVAPRPPLSRPGSKTISKMFLVRPGSYALYSDEEKEFVLYNTAPGVTYTWTVLGSALSVVKSDNERGIIRTGHIAESSVGRLTISGDDGTELIVQIALRKDPTIRAAEYVQRPFSLPSRAVVYYNDPDRLSRTTRITLRNKNSSVSTGPYTPTIVGPLKILATETDESSTTYIVEHDGSKVFTSANLTVTCESTRKSASCRVEFEDSIPEETLDDFAPPAALRPRNVICIDGRDITVQTHNGLIRAVYSGETSVSISTTHAEMQGSIETVKNLILGAVIDFVAGLCAEREAQRSGRPYVAHFLEQKDRLLGLLKNPIT